MVIGTDMAGIARLVGDPARANMLAVMLDGRAHTPGELGTIAGVTAATASGHLRQLLDGALVSVAAQGRHRYYRLASADVALMLEGIMVVTAEPAPRTRATPRIPVELREARTCYDHVAGRLGVAIEDTLVTAGVIRLDDGSGVIVDPRHPLLKYLGIDLDQARTGSRRLLCRACLDWSERRPHLAGMVGTMILDQLLERGCIARAQSGRAIIVLPRGKAELAARFLYEPMA